MTNKIISGIYIVKKKYQLIHLLNEFEKKSEYLDYFKFSNLLYQSFTEDYIKKILEAINSDKTLLIDFDKDVVNLIEEKDPKFEDNFAKYFNPETAKNWLDSDIDFENKLYGIE